MLVVGDFFSLLFGEKRSGEKMGNSLHDSPWLDDDGDDVSQF